MAIRGACGRAIRASEEQATAWLREDLGVTENAVRQLVDVPLSQGQFDALVSFVFNVGRSAFSNSTLLRLLNAAMTPVPPTSSSAGTAVPTDRCPAS